MKRPQQFAGASGVSVSILFWAVWPGAGAFVASSEALA
jgi:hypothetical protein